MQSKLVACPLAASDAGSAEVKQLATLVKLVYFNRARTHGVTLTALAETKLRLPTETAFALAKGTGISNEHWLLSPDPDTRCQLSAFAEDPRLPTETIFALAKGAGINYGTRCQLYRMCGGPTLPTETTFALAKGLVLF